MRTAAHRLWTRDLMLLLGSTMMLWGCHYFLVPILPMFAVKELGATGAQVGLISSAMTMRLIGGADAGSRLASSWPSVAWCGVSAWCGA